MMYRRILNISFIMSQQQNKVCIEQQVHEDLHRYLMSIDRVDEHFPDAPDIELHWPKIGDSYLPDAVREFNSYPTVALGWVMFIGMAVAKYWDDDWNLYSRVPDLYKYLRDRIDFDHMDDYICVNVLSLGTEQHKALSAVVGECASRTYNFLCHQNLEPGTQQAFRAFVDALHQMYLMGAAMQLKAMGFHMTRLDE